MNWKEGLDEEDGEDAAPVETCAAKPPILSPLDDQTWIEDAYDAWVAWASLAHVRQDATREPSSPHS